MVVKEGDYLIAVNGRELKAPQAPSELFVNTAGENVTLTVNSQPTATGARNVVVKPISSEYALRQLDMINTNRRKVEQATGGRVGYIYIPDMEGDGLNEFVKQFFPQVRKEGLIIDVRYNGGGFVDQLIFERLRRILAGMDSARNFASGTIPDVVFNGSHGLHHQCLRRFRRRHFQLLLQEVSPGPAHRHAHLGRRPRHSRLHAPARRRLYHPAGILRLRTRQQVGD